VPQASRSCGVWGSGAPYQPILPVAVEAFKILALDGVFFLPAPAVKGGPSQQTLAKGSAKPA